MCKPLGSPNRGLHPDTSILWKALIKFLKITKVIVLKLIVKALNRRAAPLAHSRQTRTAALRCVYNTSMIPPFNINHWIWIKKLLNCICISIIGWNHLWRRDMRHWWQLWHQAMREIKIACSLCSAQERPGPDWFCIQSDLCGFDQKLVPLVSSKEGILHRFKLSHVCPRWACLWCSCTCTSNQKDDGALSENWKCHTHENSIFVIYLSKQMLFKRSEEGRRVVIDIKLRGWYAVWTTLVCSIDKAGMQFGQDWHAIRTVWTLVPSQRLTLLPQRKEMTSTLVQKDKPWKGQTSDR